MPEAMNAQPNGDQVHRQASLPARVLTNFGRLSTHLMGETTDDMTPVEIRKAGLPMLAVAGLAALAVGMSVSPKVEHLASDVLRVGNDGDVAAQEAKQDRQAYRTTGRRIEAAQATEKLLGTR